MHWVLKNLTIFLSDSAKAYQEIYSRFVKYIKAPCCYMPKSCLNYSFFFLKRGNFTSLVGIIHNSHYVLSLDEVFVFQGDL